MEAFVNSAVGSSSDEVFFDTLKFFFDFDRFIVDDLEIFFIVLLFLLVEIVDLWVLKVFVINFQKFIELGLDLSVWQSID